MWEWTEKREDRADSQSRNELRKKRLKTYGKYGGKKNDSLSERSKYVFRKRGKGPGVKTNERGKKIRSKGGMRGARKEGRNS